MTPMKDKAKEDYNKDGVMTLKDNEVKQRRLGSERNERSLYPLMDRKEEVIEEINLKVNIYVYDLLDSEKKSLRDRKKNE